MPVETPAGATPAAPDATPGQTATGGATTGAPAPTPVVPAADPADEAALQEAGRRALAAEREARRVAEEELKTLRAVKTDYDKLKAASLSESEKAIAEAKTAGAQEASAKLTARIRTSEVRSALISAGAVQSLVDLAAKADEFAEVKVDDNGNVTGLEEALGTFRKAHPDVFAKPAAPSPGSADQGARGGQAGGARSTTIEAALEKRFAGNQ
jgi:hypothetical protein